MLERILLEKLNHLNHIFLVSCILGWSLEPYFRNPNNDELKGVSDFKHIKYVTLHTMIKFKSY